ncbi:MAG: nucleotidyltransferase domain-containing protein [Thermodesulfobacteriota bacterium]|nr:nucleotidyltransferase domain-containing protein [Thermodesulfobacteriota bacterium]
MTERDLTIARDLKGRISQVVQVLDFRIFGSRARGDADEYSDLDVFIELERVDSEIKKKIGDIIWEVGFKNFIVISPLIFTRHEIENTALRSSPIVKNIAEEGVRL